jgi:uncharacterized integral membrane protein
VFLLNCPKCRGVTPHTDDATEMACRWCGWRGRPPLGNVVRDPAAVRRAVLAEVRPVAYLLFTFGIGQLLTALMYCLMFINPTNTTNYLFGRVPQSPMLYAIGLTVLVGGVLILAAAVAVERGRNRLIAVTGAWLALTSPLLLGIPIGVWALRTLSRPEVRAAFARGRPTDA